MQINTYDDCMKAGEPDCRSALRYFLTNLPQQRAHEGQGRAAVRFLPRRLFWRAHFDVNPLEVPAFEPGGLKKEAIPLPLEFRDHNRLQHAIPGITDAASPQDHGPRRTGRATPPLRV